ncbi:hypothetical protein BJ741DRAFT_665962 [Chytriomyces cf. hyalinus JEL632]|nr:hypothetical protein BJ741DRAFT_665962 [Chytriomyces cf. hyalinus JEL632]
MLSATETTTLLSISAALASNSEPISATAIEASATSTTAMPSITTQTPMELNPHQYIIPAAILASTALLILLAIFCKRLHTNRLRRNNSNKSNNTATTISQTPDSRFSRNSLFEGSSMASTPSLRNTDLESILAYTSRTASQKRTPGIFPTHRTITSTIPRETDNATQRQSAATHSDETDNESYDVAFTSSETSKRASVETVLTISEVSDYAVYFDYIKQ